jgi:hypothetical protein
MTISSGNVLAAAGWAPEKGSNSLLAAAMLFDTGYASRANLGYAHPSTNGYLRADGIAAAVTGTNQPFSMFLSCKANGAQGVTHEIWSFARSSASNPISTCLFDGTNEDFHYACRDNSGNTKFGADFSMTTSPVVLAMTFDGTVMNSWINGVQKDSAVAFSNASAMTVDWFTILSHRSNGVINQAADVSLRRVVFRPGAPPSALLRTQYINFMMREVGL